MTKPTARTGYFRAERDLLNSRMRILLRNRRIVDDSRYPIRKKSKRGAGCDFGGLSWLNFACTATRSSASRGQTTDRTDDKKTGHLTLLDWTGRQLLKGKRGRIPNAVGPILERLKLNRKTWWEMVCTFGRRFFHVAGQPMTIDATPSRMSPHRYYLPSQTRELLQVAPHRATASA